MSAARRTRDYGVWWMLMPYGTTGLLAELVRRIPSPFPLYFLRSMFYLNHFFFTDLTVPNANRVS
jgi:hypothetical protein